MGRTERWRQKLEILRPIKRAEITAFLSLVRKAVGLTMVHVDNKGKN